MITIPEIAYLLASLLFIFGLKRLSSPRTARSGNLVAAVGMALALGGTFLLPEMGNFVWIILAIVIGTIPGWLLAKRVKMTAMPQMVSLFNGMGGACALFISLAEELKWRNAVAMSAHDFALKDNLAESFPMILGILFGSISFTGSLIAFGKLQGLVSEKPLRWPGQKIINAVVVLGILMAAAGSVAIGVPGGAAVASGSMVWIILLVVLALSIGGGTWGHSRYGYAGWSPAALILVVLVLLYLTGHL